MDNMSKIKEMEGIFGQRFSRMDDDRKLYLLDDYKMKDDKGQPIPDVINVTLPEPRMFAEKVFAIINSAHMQSMVKGKGLSDNETATIEKCVDDLFVSIDNRLMGRGARILRPFVTEQDCLRGTIASRNLLREMPGGTYVPDVLECDARYLVYEFGADGLLWAAPKFFRSRAMIESEYPEEVKKFNVGSGKNIIVYEYADKDVIEVYVGGKKIKETENTLGYVPYVIVESASGPMLLDQDFMKYRGESIYAVVRNLYGEINRHASILTSLDMMSFLGGWQYESEAGEMAKKPEHPVRGIRKVVPVERGGGYKPLPINDIKNASRTLQYLLLSSLQRATFSNLEYGTLTMPLSAVAIQKMLGTRDAIIFMRLHDMALYYRQTAKMLLDQYVKGGIPAKLGEEGLEREYEPKEIDKNFAIFYEFTATSPEQDTANTAVAMEQRNLGLSWRRILQNTLKVQDVAGELAMEKEEMANQMDTANILLDQAIAYAERGDDIDDKDEKELFYTKAEIIMQQLENILKQRAMGQLTGLNPEGSNRNNAKQSSSLLPLMSKGGGGGVSREEEATPDELEEAAASRENSVRRQSSEGES